VKWRSWRRRIASCRLKRRWITKFTNSAALHVLCSGSWLSFRWLSLCCWQLSWIQVKYKPQLLDSPLGTQTLLVCVVLFSHQRSSVLHIWPLGVAAPSVFRRLKFFTKRFDTCWFVFVSLCLCEGLPNPRSVDWFCCTPGALATLKKGIATTLVVRPMFWNVDWASVCT